jgi:hypothetical protein
VVDRNDAQVVPVPPTVVTEQAPTTAATEPPPLGPAAADGATAAPAVHIAHGSAAADGTESDARPPPQLPPLPTKRAPSAYTLFVSKASGGSLLLVFLRRDLATERNPDLAVQNARVAWYGSGMLGGSRGTLAFRCEFSGARRNSWSSSYHLVLTSIIIIIIITSLSSLSIALRLSRACLGKLMHFQYTNGAEKAVVLPRRGRRP